MANVLLGVTGSVATIYTPELYHELSAAGHAVKVVATKAALYFFDPARLDPASPGRNRDIVVLDEDEWPRQGSPHTEREVSYQRGDTVLHIELRRWADVLVIAPLDANTLAKLALGLADNCLTCVWRAWEPGRPVVLAPAMNTLMWEHPATRRHLRQLAEDTGHAPPDVPLAKLLDWMDANVPLLRIVRPVSKRLACADVGIGALAGREEILAGVEQTLRLRQ